MAIKLKADPTFVSTVQITTPAGPMAVEFEFKHFGRDEYQKWLNDPKAKSRTYEAAILEISSGWTDKETEFTPAALKEFLQSYHAAGREIIQHHASVLTGARLGN